MKNPVDHALGCFFQIGIHGEKLLRDHAAWTIRLVEASRCVTYSI